MAANEAKKILEYSTFGNKELCDKLRKIYYMILEAKLKVKDVYEIIIGFPRNEITSLEQYLNKHPLIRKKY